MSIDDFQKMFLDSIELESFDIPAGVSEKEEDAYYIAFEELNDVYDQPTKAKRIAGAKKVLKISPYVVDAHLILIREEIKSATDKIDACKKAIELGKTFIGKEAFKEFQGELWYHIPARPMMRGLHCLAMLYAQEKQPEEALNIYEEILSLNENDNQGVRYECLPMMIEFGYMEKAKTLYKKYKNDCSPVWQFLGALLHFKKGFPNKIAEKLLLKANKMNIYLMPFLLGTKKIPKTTNDYYSFGSVEEALDYLADIKEAYSSVDGSLEWVKQVLSTQN